jgi:hypothetical protein
VYMAVTPCDIHIWQALRVYRQQFTNFLTTEWTTGGYLSTPLRSPLGKDY